jgi:hypothetical protein
MKQIIDVFNGDADGVCSLIQVQLDRAAELDNAGQIKQHISHQLITGIKRDIQLLKRLPEIRGRDTQVNIFDISLDKNIDGVNHLLDSGCSVFYCDHHFPGVIPQHPKLTTIIETSAEVCTSLLINGYLNGAYPEWAIVGAFGDNLKIPARKLAASIGLTESQTEQLEVLGIAINYNGYGPNIESLHFDPAHLYEALVKYENPLDLFEQQADIVEKLVSNYQQDMNSASSITPYTADEKCAVYLLPDQTWALRVSGVFGNDLANQYPNRAHAIVSENGKGGYQISVRAPLVNKMGADVLCMQFSTGGGRKGAAGINHLPIEQLDNFILIFRQQYS